MHGADRLLGHFWAGISCVSVRSILYLELIIRTALLRGVLDPFCLNGIIFDDSSSVG